MLYPILDFDDGNTDCPQPYSDWSGWTFCSYHSCTLSNLLLGLHQLKRKLLQPTVGQGEEVNWGKYCLTQYTLVQIISRFKSANSTDFRGARLLYISWWSGPLFLNRTKLALPLKATKTCITPSSTCILYQQPLSFIPPPPRPLPTCFSQHHFIGLL